MEKNESSIDILKTIAKREMWDIQIAEENHSRRYGHSRREVIIMNPEFPKAYFISVHNPSYNKYNVYSGVFFPVNVLKNYKLQLKLRNPIDKLSFRKSKLRFKIGSKRFDSKINIITSNDIETHKLLSSSKIQGEIHDLMSQRYDLNISINELNPDFNQELKGKKYLAIFNSMEWMLEKDLIKESFVVGAKLYEKLK